MPRDDNLHPASMIMVEAKLRSLSPYSQSRPHTADPLDKETPADFDKRTWRDKAHTDPASGKVCIPPMAFKNCVADGASFLGLKIPGRNRSTYAKHFLAGILCVEPLVLDMTRDDLSNEDVFVDANGRKNSGSRVWRRFPYFESWSGAVVFNVLDRTITEDVFARVLVESGQFIGIGRFRPRNGGWYGRFGVESIEWVDTAK